MLPAFFTQAGAAVGALGGVYYLVETLAGRARPNRVTWLLWGLFPMIAFAAQRAQGIQAASWTTFAAGFTPLLVFGASFLNPQAEWRTEPRDYALMGAALLGIILWAFTRNPNLAILFSLLADALAAVPTALKVWRHPGTESWAAYAISAVGFGVSLAGMPVLDFANGAFAGWVFLVNASFALLASPLRTRRTGS